MELIHWALDHTAELLKQDNTKGWTGHWLEVLKEENAKGFHPTLPEFGFGDPTSYKLIEDVVRAHISPISPPYLPYISPTSPPRTSSSRTWCAHSRITRTPTLTLTLHPGPETRNPNPNSHPQP